MMRKSVKNSEVPSPDAFRVWLASAIETLGLNPAGVSRALGGGVNSVGTFLRAPGRDITMGRAADLEAYLRDAAREKNIELPAIKRRSKGKGAVNG